MFEFLGAPQPATLTHMLYQTACVFQCLDVSTSAQELLVGSQPQRDLLTTQPLFLLATTMPHLNSTEVNLVNKNQKKGVEPQRILSMLQRARRKKGETGPGQSAVYRLLEGSTYQPEAAETRGRSSATCGVSRGARRSS